MRGGRDRSRGDRAIPGGFDLPWANGVAAVRDLLEELTDGGLDRSRFALPSQRIWPLPLYELAS